MTQIKNIQTMQTTTTRLVRRLITASACLALATLSGCATANTVEAPVTSEAVAMTVDAESATVTVNVEGFKKQQGAIMAALVDANGYKGGKPVQARKVDVDGDVVILTFSDLPAGEYAVRMFHDVNSDGQMNANAFGMPTEPFAFSNNAVGTMGPAPWSKAKFTVNGADVVQNISF